MTNIFLSVLWHCWLADRKVIRPVKSAAVIAKDILFGPTGLAWSDCEQEGRLAKMEYVYVR